MLLISIFFLDLLVPAILYVSKRIILLFTEKKKKKVVKILALIYIWEMCTVQSKYTSVRASVSQHACIKP